MAYGIEQTLDWIIWGFIGVLSLVIIFFVVQIITYKHTLVLREITSGGKTYPRKYKAREKEKDGVLYWATLRGKIKMFPIPPSDAIDITKKGRKWVEAFQTPLGEIEYIEIKNSENKSTIINPLRTGHKELITSEMIKAKSRTIKDWKEHLPMYVGLGFLTVLVVVFVIFSGELMKPFMGAYDHAEKLLEKQDQVMNNWNDMQQSIQKIEAATTGTYITKKEAKKPPG